MNPNFRTPITPSRAPTTPDYFLRERGRKREKGEEEGEEREGRGGEA